MQKKRKRYILNNKNKNKMSTYSPNIMIEVSGKLIGVYPRRSGRGNDYLVILIYRTPKTDFNGLQVGDSTTYKISVTGNKITQRELEEHTNTNVIVRCFLNSNPFHNKEGYDDFMVSLGFAGIVKNQSNIQQQQPRPSSQPNYNQKIESKEDLQAKFPEVNPVVFEKPKTTEPIESHQEDESDDLPF